MLVPCVDCGCRGADRRPARFLMSVYERISCSATSCTPWVMAAPGAEGPKRTKRMNKMMGQRHSLRCLKQNTCFELFRSEPKKKADFMLGPVFARSFLSQAVGKCCALPPPRGRGTCKPVEEQAREALMTRLREVLSNGASVASTIKMRGESAGGGTSWVVLETSPYLRPRERDLPCA